MRGIFSSVEVALILPMQGEDGQSMTNTRASPLHPRPHLLSQSGPVNIWPSTDARINIPRRFYVVWSGSFDPSHVNLRLSLLNPKQRRETTKWIRRV